MKVNEKTATVKSSYQVFSRFMMIQQSRKVGMRDTVKYELGPVPWALAKPNGEMWSTPKSKINKDIEKETPLTTSLPENTVRVFVVSDLRYETKGSRFESGFYLCAEVSSLQ